MNLQTIGSPGLWVGFIVFVSTREALVWSGVWIGFALLFNVGVWTWFGAERGLEFLTGYLIEKSLSIDNVFVFVVIFGALGVPSLYQHRVLFWGILSALVLRAGMILGGTALLTRFHWLVYVFGGFLVLTGIESFVQRGQAASPKDGAVLRLAKRLIPSTDRYDGDRFFAVQAGRRVATPLFMALLLVEATDVVFAVDSIPAIFAVTSDPFIVFTSNIFAILGLRSLFFLLAGIVDKFRYLKVGLAAVLVFVGAKMALVDLYKVPPQASLLVIASVLPARSWRRFGHRSGNPAACLRLERAKEIRTMSMWRNVLVYADARSESSLAVAEAVRLAEHAGGKATALDVLHYLPTRVPSGLLALEHTELLDLMQEQRREQLLEEVHDLGRHGPIDVRVTHGSPAFELIRQALRGKHDLIVKTARGRDVRHQTSFGSTALHLVRKSPAPVLLVSPQRALLEAPKLLCALELDDTDERQMLNRRLLAASRQLAGVYGADIHVVHVVDGRRTEAYRAFLSPDAFERFTIDRHQLLQGDMEKLLTSELGSVSRVHAHLRDGDPSDQLVDMVQTQRFSHLIMGSVAQQRPGHLMGSVIEDVLGRVECSVLTLKPADFRSPVETTVPSAA